jgi:hypothetical protein
MSLKESAKTLAFRHRQFILKWVKGPWLKPSLRPAWFQEHECSCSLPKTGQQPDRPFNGKILRRTEPELHRKAVLRAAVEGVSLSRWISRQIENAR